MARAMGYRTLDRVIEELKARGFVERFDVRGGQFRALGSGRLFDAEDLTIREYQRFEGVSDPDDASIVYAIETRSGTKGVLVDAFGPFANPEVGLLLATDGSRQAHAALALAAAVPWPETSRAHIVLARGGIPFGPWPPDIRVAGISGAAERAVEREMSRGRGGRGRQASAVSPSGEA